METPGASVCTAQADTRSAASSPEAGADDGSNTKTEPVEDI